jgi:hypothetical protein
VAAFDHIVALSRIAAAAGAHAHWLLALFGVLLEVFDHMALPGAFHKVAPVFFHILPNPNGAPAGGVVAFGSVLSVCLLIIYAIFEGDFCYPNYCDDKMSLSKMSPDGINPLFWNRLVSLFEIIQRFRFIFCSSQPKK